MVDSKTFVANVPQSLTVKANWVSRDHLDHSDSMLTIILGNHLVLDTGRDLESFVAKCVRAHADDKDGGERDDGNDRISRGIREKSFLEAILLIDFLWFASVRRESCRPSSVTYGNRWLWHSRG